MVITLQSIQGLVLRLQHTHLQLNSMPDQLETALLSRQEQTEIVATKLPELLSSRNESNHPEYYAFYSQQSKEI